jgi:parallel beta-helix repeat protein
MPVDRPFAVESLESRVLLSTYYVSTAGSDAAAGGTSAPWRTLQKAADSVAADDTVIVRAGTYAGFNLGRSGASGARITFKAAPGVVINTRNARTADAINLEGADYVTVDGFTLRNPNGTITRAGVRSVLGDGVIVRNNNIDGMGTWGVFTGFDNDVRIENNVTSRSKSQHGIYVSNSGDRPVIRGNRIWGNYGCGIHMNGDASMGGDGLITGALVERNVIFDNGVGGGSAINADGVQSSRFQNNLLYNNHASGVSLYRIDGAAGSKNNVIVNNTIVMASDARWALNVQNASTGNKVFNNILINNNPGRGSIDISPDSLSGFRSDYNAVTNRFTSNGGTVVSLPTWRANTGQDAHSFTSTATALFVSPANNNYRLSSTSPARGKGVSVFNSAGAPTTDLEGRTRSVWDLGAYAYA